MEVRRLVSPETHVYHVTYRYVTLPSGTTFLSRNIHEVISTGVVQWRNWWNVGLAINRSWIQILLGAQAA